MNNQTFEIKNDLWASNLDESLLDDAKLLTEELSTSIETKQELSKIINHDFTEKTEKVSDNTSSLINEAFELDEEFSDIYRDEIDYTNPKNHKSTHADMTSPKNKKKKKTTKSKNKNTTQRDIEQYGLAA